MSKLDGVHKPDEDAAKCTILVTWVEGGVDYFRGYLSSTRRKDTRAEACMLLVLLSGLRAMFSRS